ncbi:hypothetical protein V3C99_012883 [Haemonchus contortus]
MKSSSTVEAVA